MPSKAYKWGKSTPLALDIALKHSPHTFCSQSLSHHCSIASKQQQVEPARYQSLLCCKWMNNQKKTKALLGASRAPYNKHGLYTSSI